MAPTVSSRNTCADSLIVDPASTHVFDNRTKVAAWALQTGLTPAWRRSRPAPRSRRRAGEVAAWSAVAGWYSMPTEPPPSSASGSTRTTRGPGSSPPAAVLCSDPDVDWYRVLSDRVVQCFAYLRCRACAELVVAGTDGREQAVTAGAVDRPTFSVQAQPESAGSWGELAVRCEALGMDALLVGDHPGVTASPYVALAAAAGATRRIRLGSYVANAALRDPLELASQLASLDVLSAGRALLGVGAGHTPAEWTMQGMAMPAAGARVTRMVEVADQAQRLLSGETVCEAPRSVRMAATCLVRM